MKVLIFCVIVIAAQAGAQEHLKKHPNQEVIDCSKVKCAVWFPPACPENTVPVEIDKSGTLRDCCKLYTCKPVCFTQWFDRDDPSGTGDYETLRELRKQYPGKICDKPKYIQAMTLSGVPGENTGQVFHKYDTKTGFVCLNSENKAKCLDYKVRFGCPCFVQ